MSVKKSDAQVPPAQLPGRNDPCHCGSGKKYKKCHEDKDAAATHTVLEKKWAEGEKAAAAQAEEDKKDPAKQGPVNPSIKPGHQAQSGNQPKHNTFVATKFNTPRKTGGGGA